MNHKILAILMITLCMVQYSMQDDKTKATKPAAKQAAKPAAKPVATAPVAYAAPAWGGYPVDWNHDGIIDWRDGWGLNGGRAAGWAEPLGYNGGWAEPWNGGWNEPWNGGWAEPWNGGWAEPWTGGRVEPWTGGRVEPRGWTGAYAEPLGWNGAYAEPLGWNGAYAEPLGWNGAYAEPWGVNRGWGEPIARRLGANADTASTLRGRSREDRHSFFGNSFRYYVTQDAIDEALFKKYDRNNDGSLDAQEIQDLMAEMGMKAPLDEIEQHIKEAGGKNGRLTFDQLMTAVNSGM